MSAASRLLGPGSCHSDWTGVDGGGQGWTGVDGGGRSPSVADLSSLWPLNKTVGTNTLVLVVTETAPRED